MLALPRIGDMGLVVARFQTSILMTALFLSACATPGDYPSLAVRDAERVTGTYQPVDSTYVPPAAPAEALGRLDSLVTQARSAHQAFVSEAPGIRPAILAGRDTEPGSDGWAKAHLALAALQSKRAPAVIALAELDRIYSAVLADAAQVDEIEAARETVVAMVQDEDRLISELSAELPQ